MKCTKNLKPKNIANPIPAWIEHKREKGTLKIVKRISQILFIYLIPALCFASVESSLAAVQTKLVGTLLPLAAIVGLAWAGMSFVMGHPNARQRLVYALVGAGVGFGAESLIALVRSLIH